MFGLVPIYNTKYLITRSKSIIESFTGKSQNSSCTVRVDLDGGDIAVVVYLDALDNRRSIFAHEAFHAAGYILDNIGYKYSIEKDEPFAYLVEWFVSMIEEK